MSGELLSNCVSILRLLEMFLKPDVILCATQCLPAVSMTHASLASAIKNELWYVKSGIESEQGPPCPYSSNNLVMTSTPSSAVLLLSNPNLNMNILNYILFI